MCWFKTIISIFIMVALTEVAVCHINNSMPCTYFGGSRISSYESSLVNCSWYAPNACCKRTEVTSVFESMYPLFGASDECSNQMNYLMCYFCSPEQYRWYNKKAFICTEYCMSVFEECRTAEFNGIAIGAKYTSGQEFCEGQNFHVVEGDTCFKFDPTVFGSAHHNCFVCWMLMYSLLLLNVLSGELVL